MVEVVKGVHAIETYATTALLVDGRLVIVDASVEDDAHTVLNYLLKMRHKPTDVATIYVTHTHRDHVAGLAVLKEKSGAKVVSHEREAKHIARQEVYSGPPGVHKYTGVAVDVLLKDGQKHDGFLAIHTPGHTPGSLSLLDEARSVMIAGDAINNEGRLGPMSDEYNFDPKQHRESIQKLARYTFETLLMGHGDPIAEGASKKVQELAARL